MGARMKRLVGAENVAVVEPSEARRPPASFAVSV